VTRARPSFSGVVSDDSKENSSNFSRNVLEFASIRIDARRPKSRLARGKTTTEAAV
jgi:hypothetical protein